MSKMNRIEENIFGEQFPTTSFKNSSPPIPIPCSKSVIPGRQYVLCRADRSSATAKRLLALKFLPL